MISFTKLDLAIMIDLVFLDLRSSAQMY